MISQTRTRLLPILLSSVAAALLSTGCASTDEALRHVDDALLSEVSAEGMAPVQQARINRDNANDALAKASRDSAWASDQADLTRAELKSQIKLVQQAKLATLLAEKNGTTSELDAAKKRLAHVTANADAERARLVLRKREAEHRRLAEKVALESSRLNAAALDYAKAQAVQSLERVAAKKVPVREYQKQVSFLQTEVDSWRVETFK